MFTEKRTETFEKWIDKLPSNISQTVLIYVDRVKYGNYSNCKSVGNGISEIKINYQKGYRVYFTISKGVIIILLAGGDKKQQSRDIQKAKEIKNTLEAKGEI
jgi:putative addiction module killer protein